MRRRRAAHSTVSRKWEQVRVGMRCIEGDHEIPAGAWALWVRARWQLVVVCEQHAFTLWELRPPNSSFGFHGSASEDVRDRQVGHDE